MLLNDGPENSSHRELNFSGKYSQICGGMCTSLPTSLHNTMESGYDNPVMVTDVANDRSKIKPALNGQTCAVNGSAAKKSDKNSENMNGVSVVPPYTTASNNHSYTNHVIDERNNKNSKNLKEKEAFSNGVSAKPQKNVCNYDKAYYDYDPHEHYPQKHPTTYLDTMFHLLKASLGTGILAMPNAFHNAGWLLGTVGTMVIGLLCTYNIHILISSEYELCKRRKVPSMTFPETVACAFEEGPQSLRWFAPYSKLLTNLFILMYQFGTSAIYVVFIASNFKQVYDTYTEDNINIRLMMVYLLIPLIAICWVRNLKLLVPFSTAANAVVIISFVLIFVYVFDDVPSLSEREPIGSLNGIPLFFGTVLFAMEAIGVIMPLKNTMKKPEKFGSLFGVLNASMLPITLLYTFIGFFGYLKYGSTTEGSVTLNLPNKDMLANAVKILYSVSIYISYALSNFVSFDILWTNWIKVEYNDLKQKIVWEYVVRTGIVLLTFVMAVAIPDLELFISFTGSFCLSTMGIATPAIVQILVYWCNRGTDSLKFAGMVSKNIFLIIIAIFAFTIGVSTSVMKFFEEKH